MSAVALRGRWGSRLAQRLLRARPRVVLGQRHRPCVQSPVIYSESARWRPGCARALGTVAHDETEARSRSPETDTLAEPEFPPDSLEPVVEAELHTLSTPPSPLLEYLPWSCPGCGAYTQDHDSDGAGFYSPTRKPVKAFLAARQQQQPPTTVEPQVTDPEPQYPELQDTQAKQETQQTPNPRNVEPPICDRCHNLLHHNTGSAIPHPSLSAVQAIFEETPYSYNHIYHVVDAADFPLSVIPSLHEWLDVSQRTQNRRSKHAKFRAGRIAEMSFIITRSDLIAPRKEQVDTLMPVIIRILRRALGREGRDLRLGNVRMVSSHRGWWTKEVKETIWDRGGGGWMVGKVNVGKSNLFQNILPKGRVASRDLLKIQSSNKAIEANPAGTEQIVHGNEDISPEEPPDEESLLPPRPREVDYPVLPIVSGLPGTTASPIRVPFGKGKGELIDLPGLSRGGLEDHILPEHRGGLVMTGRVKAKQVVIKPGQSLVISNFIRITPAHPDVTFLAFPFLPHTVEYHVCATEKADEILAQTRNHILKGLATPETPSTIRSAGTFPLSWDVTSRRAGPLTARDAVGLSPSRLPFAVYGLDVLIESIGWIEISAQVRKRALEDAPLDPVTRQSMGIPEIEVFSPNGQHIGHRETLNAWSTGGARRPSKSQRKAPPRKSMKGVKKATKLAARKERKQQREAKGAPSEVA